MANSFRLKKILLRNSRRCGNKKNRIAAERRRKVRSA
jgi:hypothetical protein